MQKLTTSEIEKYQKNRVTQHGILSKQAFASTQAYPFINASIRIARKLVNAEDSSILLSEESSQSLVFAFTDGAAGKSIRRLKISKRSGIAGQVATSGKPCIINDVKQEKHFSNFVDTVTGHTTRSVICVPLLAGNNVLGVVEMVNKQDGGAFCEADLPGLQAIAGLLAPLVDNIRRSQTDRITFKAATGTLLSAVHAGEAGLGDHAGRVAQYAQIAANALSLVRDKRFIIQCAAILHDIGKLGMSGWLSEEDNAGEAQTCKHPIAGFNLLKGIAPLQEAAEAVLYHHEHYDGSGCPRGLKGEAIPLGARLIAVADGFINMTMPKDSRTALSRKEALEKMHREAGRKYDPLALKALVSGLTQSPAGV